MQKNGTISKFKTPSGLFRQTAKKQQEQDSALRAARLKSYAKAIIAEDIEKEDADIASGRGYGAYDPRSVLGQTEAKKQAREKKIEEEQQKRKKNLDLRENDSKLF